MKCGDVLCKAAISQFSSSWNETKRNGVRELTEVVKAGERKSSGL